MIDKKISVSEQVANLTDRQALIFTWAIPHADDVGLLPYSTRTLKATLVPLRDISIEEFDADWKAIVAQKLVEEFEYDEQKFWMVKTFFKHQTLKRDRQPVTILNFAYSTNARASWDKLLDILHLEDLGFQTEDIGNQIEPEEKGREGKRREGKTLYGDPRFDFFWKEYPKKTGKGDAWKVWLKLEPSNDLARAIVISVREHSRTQQWRREGGRYIPNPSTFLNQRRFDDTPAPAAPLEAGGTAGKFSGVGTKI